jgi:hypothetical protein
MPHTVEAVYCIAQLRWQGRQVGREVQDQYYKDYVGSVTEGVGEGNGYLWTMVEGLLEN